MCQWQTQDTSHIQFPTASVVLHKPRTRTSQMPVTASPKRRLAVPALRSERLWLVSWGGHSDQPVRSGGSSNCGNRQRQPCDLRVRSTPNAGRGSFASVGQGSNPISSMGAAGRK
jgi:hypothetical protein